MPEGIIPNEFLSSPPAQDHLPRRPKRKKQPLGTGVLLGATALVGLAGGVLGAFLGLALGTVVGVTYLPGFVVTGSEWYEMRETVNALTGFVILGLLWAAVAFWILSRK